ncbi:HD-GYP domain-containing protein [Caminicella sporogenes]|uniref:HD-GYP domain-containing protein n=1 Tax=Caminicella sporogenes TaxID=166485 RepID=UPI002540A524|nr:HD-GYP domain-containing protein [Caminicella sporogenes]WIF94111.1 HD-GYP domain-containing protein [Caminicella sporogenes]
MRFVPINCVKVGSHLGKNLYDSNGRILLRKGTKLNSSLIEKIRQSGFYTIYINDEYSSNEIEDIIKPELKLKTINTLKETFKYIEKEHSSKNINLLKQKKNLIQEKHLNSLNEISKNLVDDISKTKDVLINLIDIKNMDNYTYEHSLSVSILSLVIGIELGLNKNELYNLCIGALLHDIGNAFIPKEILNKEGTLTDEEYRLIREHPLKGYEYLKENYQLTAFAKAIALQHHERIDGSGYPYGLTGDKINKLAKIVAVADVYDAMTSDRPYKKAKSPNEAIEYIMGAAGRYFDFDIARAFVKRVIPYPIGTLVKLSNGEIGVIEEINSNFPLRPKIKVIKQLATTVDMKLIDLLKEPNIVIEGVQYEIPNPSVQHYLKNK